MLMLGLGNPGAEYKYTRHNAGFILLDIIADYYDAIWKNRKKFKADIALCKIMNQEVTLLKPNTFMNISGEALSLYMSYYKVSIEDLIIVHDDLDLPFGKIKFKKSFGAGGHNGLRSIYSKIKNDYARIRIGIGRPDEQNNRDNNSVSSYVLSNFSNLELAKLKQIANHIIDSLPLFLDNKLSDFRNKIEISY